MINLKIDEVAYVKIGEPFNKQTNDNIVKMTVIGLTLIKEIKTYDVFKVIYEPNGLPREAYLQDKENDVLIVELKGCKGDKYLVPSSAIELFTDDLTEYVAKVLSIGIGIHPVELDLTDLVDELKDLIKARLGVNPSITVLDTSNVILLDTATVTTLESQRTTITESSTLQQKEQCIIQKEELTNKLTLLSDYVAKCDCNCG